MSGGTDQSRNLDPAERDRFDAQAASWWDPEGEARPLHDLNPARVTYIAERRRLDGATVVDVGCGGGILSESLAAIGADVTGIDIAPRALEVARLHRHESGVEVDYRETTVEEYAAEAPASADVVTCLEMLEHVPEPASVIASCARLLRPGGDLFISTLNRRPAAFALAIVGAEHILRLLPRGTHRYDRFIRPSELDEWLRAAGLDLRDVRGVHYDPLTRSVRVGGHVRVNYIAHARLGEVGA